MNLPLKEEVKYINKARMNFFKEVSFYSSSLVLFAFLFLIYSSFSFPEIPTSKEHENNFLLLSLNGVIVSKNTSSSLAILKNEETGKLIILTTGKSILGLTMIRVFENRIILKKGERTFQIFLGRSNLIGDEEKIQRNPDEVNVIDRKDDLLKSNQLNNILTRREFIRSEVERRIDKDWPLIIKETRFVPNLIKGKISGFKITRLPGKSILSEIGISKYDIIKEINGVELSDVENLFRLYNKFKNENRFEVSIERNGKLFRLLYILK